MRKSIKTKLHPYFLIILVFGLSKMPVGLSDEVKAALPSYKNLKAQVRRYRKKINNVPANPQTVALLQIPPDYRTTTNGDEFLLQYCVTEAGKRILIFGSNLFWNHRF